MANVLEIIKNEITQDYYKNNFPNDGQRFVAWYMRNIHLLDQRQAKDAITDGAGKSSVSCPLKPSDSAPLKHSTMPP